MKKNQKIIRMKFACPFCYEKHSIDKLYIKCQETSCENYCGAGEHDFIKAKSPLKCLHCKRSQVVVSCPNPNYGYSSGIDGIIPYDMFRIPSCSVAFVGEKDSGKTCYVAALLTALKKTFPRFFNGELSNADDRSVRIFQECYYNPYASDHTLPKVRLGLTGDAMPVNYYIKFQDSSHTSTLKILNFAFSPTESERIFLTDGEKKNLIPDVRNFSVNYVRNADAVVLLIDPMTIPRIRRRVLDRAKEMGEYEKVLKICPPPQRTPADVMKTLTGSIAGETDDGVSPINKMLAVVFTKLDILERYYIPMSGSNRLRRDSKHLEMRSYNRREHKITCEELIDLLVKYMGDEAVEQMCRFSQYSFFGVTALGKLAENNGTVPDGAAPCRVLDPMLWIFAEKSMIPKSW